MQDYKRLFGYATIIMACGFFVRSLQPAHAVNGPNVSMGTNPIEDYAGYSGFFTNTSGSDFIVTDITCEGNTYMSVSGSNVWYCRPDSPHQFASGLKVSNGETLTAHSATAFISGYYAH